MKLPRFWISHVTLLLLKRCRIDWLHSEHGLVCHSVRTVGRIFPLSDNVSHWAAHAAFIVKAWRNDVNEGFYDITG
jgi:hypothetical protein